MGLVERGQVLLFYFRQQRFNIIRFEQFLHQTLFVGERRAVLRCRSRRERRGGQWSGGAVDPPDILVGRVGTPCVRGHVRCHGCPKRTSEPPFFFF